VTVTKSGRNIEGVGIHFVLLQEANSISSTTSFHFIFTVNNCSISKAFKAFYNFSDCFEPYYNIAQVNLLLIGRFFVACISVT
jgi:hypothetical protein